MKPGPLCALAITCVLTGCSIPVAPTAAALPNDILGSPISCIKENLLPTGQQIFIGMMPSENTQTNRAYLKYYHNNAGTGFGKSLLLKPIRDAYISTSDPDLAMAWLTNSLQLEFGHVKEYSDIESLKAAKPDVFAVIDSRFQLITSRSSEVKAEVAVHFFDRNLNYFGTAKGSDTKILSSVWAKNKRTEEIVSDINEQKKIQLSALRKFDSSLKELLVRPIDKFMKNKNTCHESG